MNIPPTPPITATKPTPASTRPADQPPAGKRPKSGITIRDGRPYPDHPVWLTGSIFEAGVSPAAKLLAIALIVVMSGRREAVHVGYERLAAITGFSVQEVARAEEELVSDGYLRRGVGEGARESRPAAGAGADRCRLLPPTD